MSEVVQETQQEFWRPPSPAIGSDIVVREAIPTMAETCARCGSEFLLGSRFCHSCGTRRPAALSHADQMDAAAMAGLWAQGIAQVHSVLSEFSWNKISFPSWLRYLHFHEIKSWVGLSSASLIAFVIGIGCIAGALLVGLLTAKTFVDWQAIQFYRTEWLLAATASFVAGILLKKSSSRDRD
ncbi:MAG TPA: hypothetical protein VGU64_10995 [Terriglobales bacterium]|nr:hypothetical protein [Terriglobales bacterium]